MDLWKVWQLFDPRQVLVGLATFLFALAIFIHFLMLSTARFNWFEGGVANKTAAPMMNQNSPLPPK